MKKIKTAIILLLVAGTLSCKKTDNSGNNASSSGVTADMAATLSSGSLALNSSGLTNNLNDISANALLSVNQPCGTTLTDTATKAGTTSGVTTDYFLKYTHMLNCNANHQNDNVAYNLAFNGHLQDASIASTDTGTSTFTIAGFKPGITVFTISGEYKRTGTFTMKTGDKISGTSSIDIVATNLVITKSPMAITGGTATISITITVPKGVTHYNAPITFNGDGTANVTINSNTYNINLLTGVVMKQ